MWVSCFSHGTRVSCVETHVWAPTLGVISLSSEWFHYLQSFDIVFFLFFLCSEVFFESFGEETPFRICWWRRPQPSLQPTKDCSYVNPHKRGCQAHLTKGTASTLWELFSNGRFEYTDRRLFRKPVLLFGDAIEENGKALFDENYKWLRHIGEHHFLPP